MENASAGFVMLAVIALGGTGNELRAAGLARIGIDGVVHPRIVPNEWSLTKLDGFILFNMWAEAIRTANGISRTRRFPPFDLFMMMKRGIHVHDCIPRFVSFRSFDRREV
jgi:hypothetical protein